MPWVVDTYTLTIAVMLPTGYHWIPLDTTGYLHPHDRPVLPYTITIAVTLPTDNVTIAYTVGSGYLTIAISTYV